MVLRAMTSVINTTTGVIFKVSHESLSVVYNIFHIIIQVFSIIYIWSAFNMDPGVEIYFLMLVLNLFLIVLLFKFLIVIRYLAIIKIFSILTTTVLFYYLFHDNDDDVNCYDKIVEILKGVNLVVLKVVFTLISVIITFVMFYVLYLYYTKQIVDLKKHVNKYFVITNFIIIFTAFIIYIFVVFIKRPNSIEVM